MMKDEERKELRKLKAMVRKALKDETLTERELFAFIRSRRPRHCPSVQEIMDGIREEGI